MFTFLTPEGKTYNAAAPQSPQDVGIPARPDEMSLDAVFNVELWKWEKPAPSQAELLSMFKAAIQKYLDEFAATREYDNILSAASYAIGTDDAFRLEGQYATKMRDEVWKKGNQILADVLGGKRPMPTVEEVVSELPVLDWPNQREV